MAARIKLGELLVRAGVLDEFKLKAALAEQQRWGGRLGKILVEMNFLSEDLLVKALSKQLGIPRAKIESASIPGELLAKIDAGFCAQNGICPEQYLPDKKTLVVAMSDPTNVAAIDELRFKLGLKVETSLAGEMEITQGIDRVFYGREPIQGIDISSGPASRGQSDPRQPPLDSSFPQGRPAAFPQQMPVPPGAGVPAMGYARMMPPVQPQAPPVQPQMAQPPHQMMMPPPSAPPPGLGVPQGNGGTALDMAIALDTAARKQQKALRVMLELLIEKGVFSRDEYLQLVNRR